MKSSVHQLATFLSHLFSFDELFIQKLQKLNENNAIKETEDSATSQLSAKIVLVCQL